jgi:hypothetical protein
LPTDHSDRGVLQVLFLESTHLRRASPSSAELDIQLLRLRVDLDVGNTVYTASWAFARKLGYRISPDRCGPHARFESTPEGAASINYSFRGAKVIEERNVFSVMRKGTVAQEFVVLKGYVVQMKSIFAIDRTVGTSYSQIGHAPRIVAPNPDEVVAFPQAFLHGCAVSESTHGGGAVTIVAK